MKKVFITLLCALFISCNQTEVNLHIIACGIEEPQKNIPWLVELIDKAKVDKSGNYLGSIWLEKYQGNDIFVTDMAIESGGLAYHFFDCEGKTVKINDIESFVSNMKKNIIVFTTY